jgi:CRP/FNR family transcriptional regulator, anaerobic regulatory protein
MPLSATPPPHRAELYDTLRRGDALLLHAAAADERLFRAGETVVAAGDPALSIYRLRTGWLCRSRLLADDRRQILGLILPGDVFGASALLDSRISETVECLTDATVNLVPRGRLETLAAREPAVALCLMAVLAEDVRRQHDWMVRLGRGTAEECIAALLIEMRTRVRRLGLLARNNFRLPLTQQQMGDCLGLTVVHVNRLLRRLREDGIVTIRGGMVMIEDAARLERIAGRLSGLVMGEEIEVAEPPVDAVR